MNTVRTIWLYAILDLVIDSYFPIIEEIGDRLNAIDEQLEFGFDPGQRLAIRDVRADLLLLRRTVWPQREAIAATACGTIVR